MTANKFTSEVLKKMSLLTKDSTEEKPKSNLEFFFKLNEINRKDYIESITDRVFLFIQNDRASMQNYLGLLRDKATELKKNEEKNIIEICNLSIGKYIKTKLNIDNIYLNEEEKKNEVRCNAPLSTLIKSYTKHCE